MTAPADAKGALINFGTWQSAIYGFAMAHELKALRRKLFPERLPLVKPRLSARGVLHHSDVVSETSVNSSYRTTNIDDATVVLRINFKAVFHGYVVKNVTKRSFIGEIKIQHFHTVWKN